MSETTETGTTPALRRLFNLRRDQASPETIDGDIRDGVKVGGTSLWVLMCAILIASIGLNVRSCGNVCSCARISTVCWLSSVACVSLAEAPNRREFIGGQDRP